MKGDIVELLSGEEAKSGVTYYEIMVVQSGFVEGLEGTLSIRDIAGHFEYL
jgi:hypothetical protein